MVFSTKYWHEGMVTISIQKVHNDRGRALKIMNLIGRGRQMVLIQESTGDCPWGSMIETLEKMVVKAGAGTTLSNDRNRAGSTVSGKGIEPLHTDSLRIDRGQIFLRILTSYEFQKNWGNRALLFCRNEAERDRIVLLAMTIGGDLIDKAYTRLQQSGRNLGKIAVIAKDMVIGGEIAIKREGKSDSEESNESERVLESDHPDHNEIGE
ncbi:hypothetical protein Syun_027922 [Stephania yunnanensis]|uniref:Uncharacterized protein n=1 Tax=Stephania yunnanensis TaxID=152371 RepID=A0AAP0EGF9_9MAGN